MHTEYTFYKIWAAISYALTYGIILPLFVIWFLYIMVMAFYVKKPKAEPSPDRAPETPEQAQG